MINLPDVQPHDQWTFVRELTDEELAVMRQESIDWIERYTKNTRRPLYEFTCDECPRKRICFLVYDPYNFDGDCLYDK